MNIDPNKIVETAEKLVAIAQKDFPEIWDWQAREIFRKALFKLQFDPMLDSVLQPGDIENDLC
jgi:hypothetical protein